MVTPRNTDPYSLLALDPSMPHVTVSGTGHWIQLDRPDEVNRLLDDFLRTVEGTGPVDGVSRRDAEARKG